MKKWRKFNIEHSHSRLSTGQVICWDRGRPARKRAEARRLLEMLNPFSALRAHCGRDARGRSKSLE